MVNLSYKNNLLLAVFISVSLFYSASIQVTAAEKPLDTITTISGKIEYNKVFAENLTEMNLNLNDEDKLKLREEAPNAEMDGTIKLTPEETELKQALEIQKGKDVEDIKMLWEATLERNAVIRFTLEKLATPPQQRHAKSSLMARSIATMLQGAAIVPSLFGMGMMTEMGGAFGGQLLANAFSKKFVPPPGMPSLTEPELIQLTGLIEELQELIINSYYNYKSSLEGLVLERKNVAIQKRNYQKALDSHDETAIIISSALYDKATQAELRLKQQVKLHRVQLERLAGLEAVANLNLTLSDEVLQAKYNFDKVKTDDIRPASSTKVNDNNSDPTTSVPETPSRKGSPAIQLDNNTQIFDSTTKQTDINAMPSAKQEDLLNKDFKEVISDVDKDANGELKNGN